MKIMMLKATKFSTPSRLCEATVMTILVFPLIQGAQVGRKSLLLKRKGPY